MRENAHIDSPILATGRGGSGTRLLAALLEQIGVFLGNELNKSGDGLEWKAITREMISKDISIHRGSFDEQWKTRLIENAENILGRSGHDRLDLWGFKLPEVMHLFPEFIDAFPKARLIVLLRHPVSVCLRRTHVSSRLGNPVGDAILPAAYQFLELNSQHIDTQKAHINNAISWEFQIRKFIDSDCIESLPHEQLLFVRYEDLVCDSSATASIICQFLYRKSEHIASQNTALDIDIDRVNRIAMDDDRIEAVWEICGETAKRLGYEKYDFLES